MIRVFFRYDDYSQTSPAHVDAGVVAAFGRAGMTCTFAVIPAVTAGGFRDPAVTETHRLNGDKLASLRAAVAAGTVDVALHGLHHRTEYPAPPHSEFAGVDPARQLARICEGKRALEESLGAPVTTFVPPWNTYDEATLAALCAAGLTGISANREAALLAGDAIRYLPITIELHDLRRAIEAASRSPDAAAAVGVLMHPYDFRESGDARGATTVADLERELQWLRAQPNVRVMSVSQLLAEEEFDTRRFAANRPSVLESVFPRSVRKTTDTPLYLSAPYALRARREKLIRTAAVFVLLAVLGYAASRALIGLGIDGALGDGVPRVGYAAAALVAAVAVRAWVVGRIFFRPLAAACLLVGGALAFGLAPY